jgi:hypothetical protein
LVIVALMGSIFAGCDPHTRPETTGNSTSAAVTISLATPAETARGALRVIQQELEAYAQHNRAAADAARAQLRSLGAWKTIRENATRGRSASQAALSLFEDRLLDSWIAILLFYRDGIDFDRAELISQTESRAIVRIPVHRQIDGRNYRAAVRVETIRQPDGTWLVSQITFFGRKGENAPATAPAGVTDHAPSSDR